MARRLPSLIAAVAVLLLASPTAAFAAYAATVTAPDGAVVRGPAQVRIQVERGSIDLGIRGAKVRPVGGGDWHALECISDCGRGSRSPVFALELDPRTGAPFATSPMANGDLTLETVVERDMGGSDRSAGQVRLSLRVPGSPVGGLAATVDGSDVRLAWTRPREPDILRYRVERCAASCDAGGDWEALDDVAPSASSYGDDPGVGTHRYRVVTVRDAGDDGDGTIETASSPITAEVRRPEPDETASPSPSPSPSDSDGDPDRDGSGDEDDEAADGGSSDDDRTPTAPALGDAPALERDTSRSERRSTDIRTGRAPSVALGNGGSGIPDLPAIGDVFSTELDYSGEVPDIAPSEPVDPDEDDQVVLATPGRSSGSFLGRLTDPNRVAVPIAGGLLMTAIGLHLWRWLRVPLR